MAHLLAGLLNRCRWIPSLSSRSDFGHSVSFYLPSGRTRWFGGSADSVQSEFPVENAYDILGVSESSTFSEIKASFRRLAKETHPDLAASKNDPSSTKRFVQVLAAYEILSDSTKRAHYDRYLLSQKRKVQMQSRQGSRLCAYESHIAVDKEMEVVEWLEWYRSAINDILAEKNITVGTGYFAELRADFHSAIHAAYYGPEIDSMELLPDCFEAEERSADETPEVLHLVSGRDMFGMVCLADDILELSSGCYRKLELSYSMNPGACCPVEMGNSYCEDDEANDIRISRLQFLRNRNRKSDAYKDLKLYISERLVATATRFPPKSFYHGKQNEDNEDRIHIFLNVGEDSKHLAKWFPIVTLLTDACGSKVLLGTISGLGTSPDEGSCFVYDGIGSKTHVIMKHRTLLVKHMHWYRIGETVSICECRCSRARLPPSKYWLFEPRCGMHDIGGWYIETFGKDKKGRTVLSQRFWDGFDSGNEFDERLHPAIYLLALAYRTLDLEDEKRRKRSIINVIGVKFTEALHWCKRLVWRGPLGS